MYQSFQPLLGINMIDVQQQSLQVPVVLSAQRSINTLLLGAEPQSNEAANQNQASSFCSDPDLKGKRPRGHFPSVTRYKRLQ